MEGDKEMLDRIINRLVEWLESEEIPPDKIVECIKYITKK